MASEVPALIKKIEQKKAMIIVEKENESDSETEFLKKTKLRKQEPRIKLNELKVPKSKAPIDDSLYFKLYLKQDFNFYIIIFPHNISLFWNTHL
jgi:hypothetical protein